MTTRLETIVGQALTFADAAKPWLTLDLVSAPPGSKAAIDGGRFVGDVAGPYTIRVGDAQRIELVSVEVRPPMPPNEHETLAAAVLETAAVLKLVAEQAGDSRAKRLLAVVFDRLRPLAPDWRGQ